MTSRILISASLFLFAFSASADYPWETKKLKLTDTGETLRIRDIYRGSDGTASGYLAKNAKIPILDAHRKIHLKKDDYLSFHEGNRLSHVYRGKRKDADDVVRIGTTEVPFRAARFYETGIPSSVEMWKDQSAAFSVGADQVHMAGWWITFNPNATLAGGWLKGDHVLPYSDGTFGSATFETDGYARFNEKGHLVAGVAKSLIPAKADDGSLIKITGRVEFVGNRVTVYVGDGVIHTAYPYLDYSLPVDYLSGEGWCMALGYDSSGSYETRVMGEEESMISFAFQSDGTLKPKVYLNPYRGWGRNWYVITKMECTRKQHHTLVK